MHLTRILRLKLEVKTPTQFYGTQKEEEKVKQHSFFILEGGGLQKSEPEWQLHAHHIFLSYLFALKFFLFPFKLIHETTLIINSLCSLFSQYLRTIVRFSEEFIN